MMQFSILKKTTGGGNMLSASWRKVSAPKRKVIAMKRNVTASWPKVTFKSRLPDLK